MFLKELVVIANGDEVRRVSFRRGLNLIVDQTPIGDSSPDTTTGNNVGKTTALRCVDFCLGGKAESLYIDAEFKRPNEAVQKFLEDKAVEFVLDLEDTKGDDIRLSRQFGDAGGRINGEALNAAEYASRLRWFLFRVAGTTPTLRQMTPKFVRVEPQARSNILRWIPFGTDAQYENVWLTLFGFRRPSLLTRRLELKKGLKGLNNQRTALTPLSESPRQERPIVEKQLEAAQAQLANLSLEGAYEGSIEQLRLVRTKVGDCNQRLAEIEAELGQVRRTLRAIGQDAPNIDVVELEELFADAGRYVEKLHADFEQLVEFHKALAENKTTFVKKSETELVERAANVRRELDGYLREESELLGKFADPDVFADVRQLSDEIARLSRRRGELESLEATLVDLKTKIDAKKKELAQTEAEIEAERENIEATLESFNSFFAEYTKRLYGETYLMTFKLEETRGGSRAAFALKNLEGHEGSGKKKGVIAAFDLAYLRFQQEVASKAIRFTLNDEVELIDTNQLRTLFEIAESIDGQFVIPVLRDRLAGVAFETIDDCVVLELSQDDRFFGIP